MLNRLQIEELIDSGNLVEAMELLKPAFSEKKVAMVSYDLLYRMVKLALEKGDVRFAVENAALYGSWFDGNLPKEVSWNSIIHQALAQGGFPELGFRADFLEPGRQYYSCGVPDNLKDLGVQIWQFFKDHNWNVPGHEVSFHGSRHNGRESNDKFLFAYKVEAIRGKDFFLGFSGIQGLIDYDWNSDFNNTGGFNFIAVEKYAMRFYEDYSGPSAWEYTGDNWEAEVARMYVYSSYWNTHNWKQIPCEVPAYNRVFLEFLFDPKGNQETIESKRKTGFENREYLVSKITTALENVVIPKLLESVPPALKPQKHHHSLFASHEKDAVISAKQMAQSAFGRKRPKGHDDPWHGYTPTYRP